MLTEDFGEIFNVVVGINVNIFAVDCCAGERGSITHEYIFISGHIKGIVTLLGEPSVYGDGKEIVLVGFLDLVETNDAARTPTTFRA